MISDDSPLFAQSDENVNEGLIYEVEGSFCPDLNEDPSFLAPTGGSIFDDAGSGFEPDLESVDDLVQREGSYGSIADSEYCYGFADRAPLGASEGIGGRSANEGGTGLIYTTFLIVNAGLGAALLNFPKSFDEAGGLGIACLLQMVLMVFILIALLVLASSADQCRANNLQEAMYGSAGKFGKYLSAIIVALYTFGTTITFLIIIGDQFDRILESWVGPLWFETWYFNRTFTLTVASLLFILPLCFSKKIDFLSIPSTLGVIAILYIVLLIIYEYYFGNYTPGKIKTKPDSWLDVFLIVPVICFGYQCHVSVIPIYSCMRRRNLKNFAISSFSAIAICCFCYTGAAGWGYYTFGSHIQPDILLMYDASDPKVLIANIAMALKTITTYPILLFCGREAIQSVIYRSGGASRLSAIIISLSWFLLSLLGALFIPDIDLVIKGLGSMASIFIFVFPGICLLRYTLRTDPSFVRKKAIGILILSLVFIALGFFIFGVVLTQTIRRTSSLHWDHEKGRYYF